MSGCPRRKNRVIQVCIAILAMTMILGTIPAEAEIEWRSGTAGEVFLNPADARLALTELAQKTYRRHIVVQFSRPVTPEERGRLADAGIGLQSYLGSHAYFASLKTASLDLTQLRVLPSMVSAMEIAPQWKMAPTILADEYPEYAITFDPDTKSALVAAYLMFHRDVPLLEEGLAAAKKHGADVVDVISSVNGLVIEMPLDGLYALADEDAVMWIEPPLPFMTETNDSNSVVTQTDTAQNSPYNLDGSGINVMVYDAGYALASHSDFSGRLTVRDSSGLNNHSTHVAGTIGGDGSSNSTYEGMAPNVTMQSYGFEYDGSGTFLYTNPGDIESDYNQAINTYGVDISNNSIGSNVEPNGFSCSYQGDYGATAALLDEIVGGSLGSPFRIVWANGNERQGSRCDVEGYGDYYSTAPPACGKNHITVGALNSNNDSMTSFSSWGPTDDGRLKPDISGPGCQSTGDGGVTSCSSSGGYTTMCGTSMAAPTVTGCLALLLEDYRAQFPSQPDPRNSTLKILLAHNAVDLGNTGPDYQNGYGSIRIVDTIDFMRGGEFEENQVSQGGSVNYQVDVPGGTSELKITLAWDDVAGTPNVNPNLVNDLDLVVMSPSSSRAYPWTLNPSSPSSAAVRNQADHTNNIEQVLVNSPEAGTWTVTVQGYNVPDGPQSYSICGSPGIGVSGPPDCNNNGVPDDQDISGGTSQDCNLNGVPDECDISFGTSTDCNTNGIPDDCEPGGNDDCNGNSVSDLCDIVTGTSQDCNSNGIPDECEVGSGPTTISITLDTDPNWSTEGLWDFGQPTGGGGQYGGPDPTSGYTGNNVYGYNLGGDYENSLPERHLTSTAIDCSGLTDVTLSFRRWLGVERSTYDHAYIRVSNNGSSWSTVWSNPDSETSDSSWTLQQYDISSVADGQSAVYLRWTQGTTDGSWQYCGWNIDDIEITGSGTGGGPGDCNGNGIPDECDISSGFSADCNNNGVPDECDISEGTSEDTNSNGIPDECESNDCNGNGIPDDEDISGGTSQDCDGNGVPDECQTDSDGDGVIDPCDGCPSDPNKTAPGVCGCGTPDTDSDGDGTPDCIDGCPNDPNKVAPGDCGCGTPDTDSDGDGTSDCNDGCPNDPNKIAPGDCGCGVPDSDSDGDGVADCIDGCPNDPDKIEPGLCGCGVPDDQTVFTDDFETDQGWTAVNLGATTGDWQRGVPVDDDGWAYDPASDSDGSGQCFLTQNQTGNTDVDNGDVQLISPIFDLAAGDVTISYDYFLRLTNQDGNDRLLVEIDSNGGSGPWTEIARHDTDGGLSWRSHTITQADLDTAGVTMTSNMQIRFTTNDADTQSINESGLDAFQIIGAGCGGITDCNNNGIPDDEDISGGTSEDCDGNGVPDECQADSDDDGVIDPCDGCPDDPDKTDPGDCGCGTPDTDSDGDGTPDCDDGCPNDPNKIAPGDCGCGVPDTDSDGDGTADCIDGCPSDPNKIDPGVCGCGTPDVDSDGDGWLDCVDNCPSNYNPAQEDCDTDGTGDACAGEPDCNTNGVPDSCDIADGTSEDTNSNGIPDECEGGESPIMETGTVNAGGSYVTVNLSGAYVSPVVVCSAEYSNNSIPIVTRVSNVTATSFDVRIQNPSGSAVAAETVSYIVMEEGTWNIDGVSCEAQKYTSTVTDENNSWNGEAQSYNQSYTSPVVIGQVMSENDPDWSCFWCAGSSRSAPPSATTLTTGKEVAEDTDTTRADETVGFIVFEAGHGTMGGTAFEALVGADSVRGPDNGGTYTYTFNTAFGASPAVAVVTMAAMDGGNGGWAVVDGSPSAASMNLLADEDQVGDSERRHTTEQVGYVVFEAPVVIEQ